MKAHRTHDLDRLDQELDKLDLDGWRGRWNEVGQTESSRPWVYGDLFNAGRRHVDPKLSEEAEIHDAVAALVPAMGECGITLRGLKIFGWVAKTFPRRRRQPDLSWNHHREIWAAGVPTSQHRKWLAKAALKKWSVRDLRVALAPESRPEPMEPPPVRFIARRWADQGEAGMLELFPLGEPVHPGLLASFRQETRGLIDHFVRIGLLSTMPTQP